MPFRSTLSYVQQTFVLGLLVAAAPLWRVSAVAESHVATPACRIEAVDYKGWHAQQLSNEWVQLIVVPQNGGRLIQVSFAGHPFLFVNPKYAGKYVPPASNEWFNYGGDKLWLLPEGNDDEQHWAGGSDILDDGQYTSRIVSEGQECKLELTGQPDQRTGVQFVRTIAIAPHSPRIRFHAIMRNITGYTVEWSMQSVSQYDTASEASRFNRDFWTFTPTNRDSSYLNRYHVRFGPAENSAAAVRDDGLFSLHYSHLAAELWLDSPGGWLAVVDGRTKYAMVERFRYESDKAYPGNASVIFWTNGPEVKLNPDGEPMLVAGEDGQTSYYLEAEINSPLCRLAPGETCTMDTEWFPTRGGDEFQGVTEAAIIARPLRAITLKNGKISLTGSFGVLSPGRLLAHFYGKGGSHLGTTSLGDVNPSRLAIVQVEVTPVGNPVRVSLHLEDSSGVDRGPLQETRIAAAEHD